MIMIVTDCDLVALFKAHSIDGCLHRSKF